MSTQIILRDIELEARERSRTGKSDAYELEATLTSGKVLAGPRTDMARVHYLTLLSDGYKVMIPLDAIQAVRVLWL